MSIYENFELNVFRNTKFFGEITIPNIWDMLNGFMTNWVTP